MASIAGVPIYTYTLESQKGFTWFWWCFVCPSKHNVKICWGLRRGGNKLGQLLIEENVSILKGNLCCFLSQKGLSQEGNVRKFRPVPLALLQKLVTAPNHAKVSPVLTMLLMGLIALMGVIGVTWGHKVSNEDTGVNWGHWHLKKLSPWGEMRA